MFHVTRKPNSDPACVRHKMSIKCWQLASLQTTDTFTSVCDNDTILHFVVNFMSGGRGDGGGVRVEKTNKHYLFLES